MTRCCCYLCVSGFVESDPSVSSKFPVFAWANIFFCSSFICCACADTCACAAEMDMVRN